MTKASTKKPSKDTSDKVTAADSSDSMSIKDNCVVSFHYRLCEIDQNGIKSAWLEQSMGREPLLYLHGHGNLIPGLENVLAGKKIGDEVKVTLSPELAYGPRHPHAVHRVPLKHLLKSHRQILPGQIVTLQTDKGPKNVVVIKVGKFNVDVDVNHPYAGRILHYEIQVDNVRAASAEEIAHRHAHGAGGHHH
jgi:FKBP-type peptidyl-prolyl cis-trans isomerase SlyD